MEKISKITSFTVDHDKIDVGIYISRIDGDITTYDLRTRKPNAGDYLDDITNELAVIVVGFSGMLLPYLVSLVPPRKTFWIWYLWLIISGICLLSFAVSIAGIFMYVSGGPMANEDVTQIMKFADEYYVLYLAILIVLSVIRSIQIVRSKPIKRCMKCFGV